jgi:phosphatidylinositol alpha-1,6-mannosyltransferase
MDAAREESKTAPLRSPPPGGGAPLLLLTEKFLPAAGGTIRWFENLARRYEDGPVAVLARRMAGDAEVDAALPFRVERVPFRTFPFLRPESLVNYLRLRARAARIVRERRPAILVAARAVPEGLVALLLRRRFGVPYVVFAQGEEIAVPVAERRRHGTRIAKFLAMRRVYAGAGRVLANSAYTEGLLRAFGHEGGNVVVHHPGVDPARFRPDGPDLRRELGVEERRVLLTVGALMERKGQSAVVGAMPGLLRRVPDAVYLVAGSGPAEGAIREAARAAGVEGSVRLLGRLPEEKLPDLYRTADVFVLANRRPPDGDLEGFGIVYLEAAASGLPVVAGAPGGNAEAFVEGRTALRVDPEDPGQLAAVLGGLLADRERARRLGAEGRAFVRGSFDWAPLAAEFNRILREVRAGAQDAPAPSGPCPCCGSTRSPKRSSLRGRAVRRCADCDFAALAPGPGGGRAGDPLLASGAPVEFLRSRLESLAPGASFRIEGIPNLRAIRWGFLSPRALDLAPGTKGIYSPRSLREALRRAGFVGIEAKTRGSEVRRFLRSRIPILDARDGLEAFFRAEAGASGSAGVEPPAARSLLGRLADACGLGPVLSVRARRP